MVVMQTDRNFPCTRPEAHTDLKKTLKYTQHLGSAFYFCLAYTFWKVFLVGRECFLYKSTTVSFRSRCLPQTPTLWDRLHQHLTGNTNKKQYLSKAELSSSSLWVSVVLLSLDRTSILFIMTSSMSLIFLSTPRDSWPPRTEKHTETI